MELTPKTRKEVFLAAAGGQDVTTPTPVTREEVFLDAIAKGGGGGSSGGGVLYVTASNTTLDKNLEEIQTALDGGKVVMFKRESQSDGVFYDPLILTASLPEDPYYGVTFYDFRLKQELSFYNTTGPTDPLVLTKS